VRCRAFRRAGPGSTGRNSSAASTMYNAIMMVEVIDMDLTLYDGLKVVFIPNYNAARGG
jgi:hypothetical protein